MSDMGKRFDPSELDGGDAAELSGLLRTARDLEAFAASEHSMPSADFEDRVMAAIAAEPPPRAMLAGGFITGIRNAWRLAWSGGRPMAVRAQAFALLLVVAVAVGSVGSLAAVGVARLLSPEIPPPSLLPNPSPSPSLPSASPSPSDTAEPTETAEPNGTDDHGGGSGSGSGSDSGSGSGSDDHATSEPDDASDSSHDSETPEPDTTPHD
jgi:hypothetical protein